MRFVRHRRGLSTVVTSAMLLTGVVILGTAMVGWSQSNLNVFQLSLANNSANATNKINENLAIESIGFSKNIRPPGVNSNTVINATLTNIGTLPLKVTQMQINNTAVRTYWAGIGPGDQTFSPTIILPQKSYTIAAIIPNSLKWSSKSLSTITVMTERGSIFTTQAVAPVS